MNVRATGRRAAPPEARLATSVAEAQAREPRLRILDVRDESAFAAGHLPEAGNISAAGLAARPHELPARDVPLLVVHDSPAISREAAAALAASGHEHVQWLERALADEIVGLAHRGPAARLWSPSPFLERVVARLPRGRALDLACGSGRSAVFLALAAFAHVEAWDIDARALALARELAARHGAGIVTREIDLESGPLAIPAPLFDVVVVARYLHRELFPWIESALAPGGALVYETFRLGQERFGPPRKPRHLLQSGELRGAFPGLVVEEYEETPADAPPVLARLLARKPR